MWVGIGFAGLIVWLVSTLWFVRRASHGQKPVDDPYEWQ